MTLAHSSNKYVNDTAPWTLKKTDITRCGTVLNVASRAIVNAANLMYPVIPDTALKILRRAGAHSGEEAPGFSPRMEDPAGRPLGSDDTLLFSKITEDQIKLEIEKLNASRH